MTPYEERHFSSSNAQTPGRWVRSESLGYGQHFCLSRRIDQTPYSSQKCLLLKNDSPYP